MFNSVSVFVGWYVSHTEGAFHQPGTRKLTTVFFYNSRCFFPRPPPNTIAYKDRTIGSARAPFFLDSPYVPVMPVPCRAVPFVFVVWSSNLDNDAAYRDIGRSNGGNFLSDHSTGAVGTYARGTIRSASPILRILQQTP